MSPTERVWEYPRPPRIELCSYRVRVELDGDLIADTTWALRVLETSHPPTIYIPIEELRLDYAEVYLTGRTSVCEYKGIARYMSIRDRDEAAWFYPDPNPGYDKLFDHWAFYPSRMDACYMGNELVQAQEGDFYGGWITNDLVGPFKGAPGTAKW